MHCGAAEPAGRARVHGTGEELLEEHTVRIPRLALTGLVLAVISLTSGCVVHTRDGGYHDGYREGYYDREHNRWYHQKSWRDCEEHDVHCR
jgi:hypothetical protein